MSEAYVTINSPDALPIQLGDVDALNEFLDQQMPQFGWLMEHNVDLHNHLYNLLQNIRSYAGSGRAQGYIDQAFISQRFPISGSPFSQYVAEIAETSPDVAATIIAIVTRAIGTDLADWRHMRALGALLAFEQKLTAKSVESSQAAFTRAVTSFQRQEQSSRGRSTAYENRLQSAEARYVKLLGVTKRYLSHKIAIQRDKDDQRLKASLNEMEATKALYMEHMALKAPVEYWKKKATSHGVRSAGLRSVLLKYAFIGGTALVSALVALAGGSIWAISAGVPAGVLVVLATIGVVLTTIAFWAGRILTRLYLSEVHLGIDASERATMVETYLALTSVAQASTEDRAIILASLFRPTADGIVKDDAAPELSPASLLSRALTPG